MNHIGIDDCSCMWCWPLFCERASPEDVCALQGLDNYTSNSSSSRFPSSSSIGTSLLSCYLYVVLLH